MSLQELSKLKDNFPYYAEKNLKIRTKEGKIVPFVLNNAQKYIHGKLEEQRQLTGKVRALILKGRQQGCSTYVEGRFYHKTTFRKGVRSFILTHEDDATNNLFEMAKRFHEHSYAKPSTKSSNAKELIFDRLDSGFKVGTAGNKAVGRSSTIQLFHGSEVAFWPNAAEHAKGVLQAIPDAPDTESILESTANGLGNYYHIQWQLAESGQSDYIAVFVPWYWQSEYRKEPIDFKPTEAEIELSRVYGLDNHQLMWRRQKIQDLAANGVDGEKSFMQEYPCNAQEAFQTSGIDSLIKPQDVLRARKCKAMVSPSGAKVCGVDPARYGDDRTAIIDRQGRLAHSLVTYSKKDTMEVAGLCHTKLNEAKNRGEPYDAMFVDVGGLGAGVVDRLNELGWSKIVIAVNGGSHPLDAKKYYNKRAEMWGLMNVWLKDEPVIIPDVDSLHADLCSPTYKFDSNSRLVLEKKEDIKKRGLRSPDEGDALALTFAQPVEVKPKEQPRNRQRQRINAGWMGS